MEACCFEIKEITDERAWFLKLERYRWACDWILNIKVCQRLNYLLKNLENLYNFIY